MGQGSRYTGVERYEGPEGVRWIARASKRLSGGKRMHWEKVYEREADANRGRRAWLAQHDNGTAVDPGKATLADAMATWRESHLPTLAPKTAMEYARTLRVHIAPSPLAVVPLHRLDAARIQDWYNGLKVGPRTREIIHLRLCQVLDLAVKHRRIAHNPARDCEVPHVPARRGTMLTQAQIDRFLAIAADDTYHPLWHLAVATGLRRGELLGLRWQDVHLSRGLLRIQHTVIWLDRPFPQPRTKTPSGERGIRIDGLMTGLLAEHKAWQSRRIELAGDAWEYNDLVFCTGMGRPLGAPNVHRTYKRLLADAVLPATVKIHDMRHTHLSHLLNNGVPLTTVARRGGYRNAKVLLSVYAHADEAGELEAMAVAGKLIGGEPADLSDPRGGEMAGK